MTILQKLRLIFRCFRFSGLFGLIAGIKYCMTLDDSGENGVDSSIFTENLESKADPAAKLPECFGYHRPKQGRFERQYPDGRDALGWKIK